MHFSASSYQSKYNRFNYRAALKYGIKETITVWYSELSPTPNCFENSYQHKRVKHCVITTIPKRQRPLPVLITCMKLAAVVRKYKPNLCLRKFQKEKYFMEFANSAYLAVRWCASLQDIANTTQSYFIPNWAFDDLRWPHFVDYSRMTWGKVSS